jgi:hypothetical protein
MKMKYAVFTEFDIKDRDKVVKRGSTMEEYRKKNPGKLPEQIFPGHNMAGETKGLAIVEATPEQLLELRYFWMPYLKIKAVPLLAQGGTIAEKYPKMKE